MTDGASLKMTSRPFVTARRAAELLGVPVDTVIADVQRGWSHLDSLNGGQGSDYWLVYSYEVEGDRLEMHRARLRVATPRESDANG